MPVPSLKDIANFLLDAVLPARCPVSGEIVDRQFSFSPDVWAGIDFISDPMCKICGVPFDFEVEEDSCCTACLDHAPIYKMHRSPVVYNESSRDFILAFKHGDQTHMAPSFVPWIMNVGGDILDQSDFIIPVPLYYTRLIYRRYNQAALIARSLSRVSGVDVVFDGLKRVRATKSQGHLSFKARRKNVSGAFCVPDKYKERLQGKRVVLVDDVFTTGATITSCAKALKQAGVDQVFALSLARVKPENGF